MDNLVTMSPEALAKVEESLASMEKVLKDKDAVVRMGMMSKEKIAELETVYAASKKLYEIYKPKPVGK